MGELATLGMIAINDINDRTKLKEIDGTVVIDEMKTVKLIALMEILKLLEFVVPMKLEYKMHYCLEWLN